MFFHGLRNFPSTHPRNQISSIDGMKKQEKGEMDKGGGATVPPAHKANKLSSASSSSSSSATTTPSTPTASKPVPSIMGMKQSKSDHSGLSGKGSKSGHVTANKKYMSKSHESLSSGSKKKLTVVKEDETVTTAGTMDKNISINRSMSSEREPSSGDTISVSESVRSAPVCVPEKNKENQVLKEKEKNAGFAKLKPVKPNSLTTIRKASSTQSIDCGSNTSGSVKSIHSNRSSASQNSMKRAQSSQNVSKDKLLRKRTSAPADVMAYNAELLANFEKEKKTLEARISELTKITEGRKAEIEKYKYEIKRLKDVASVNNGSVILEELEQLKHQNKHLTDRLKELGFPVEQVTDTEKLIMKIGSGSVKSVGRSGDSVGASDCLIHASISCDSLSTEGAKALPLAAVDNRVNIAKHGSLQRSASLTNSEPGVSLADLCGTPEHPSVLSMDPTNWDKQSNKSCNSDVLSEISVACLTERILQMEETNYSTTEELQATLQELGDLQDAVNELTEENGRLSDEKTVLLESLCTQTEKLENARRQVEQLKSLLISGNLPDKSERESHLLQLLKSAQEEREELLRKQTEWSNALHSLETECKEYQEMLESARDKLQLAEDRANSIKLERDANERLVTELRETVSSDQIEMACLKTLLESERCKMSELEKCRQAQDQSEFEALLDQTRQEKARGEQRLANMQESLALSQCELTRVKDVLATREEELKVTRNNAKTEVTSLQLQLDKSEKERLENLQQLDTLHEHIDQLQQDCDNYLDEKKTFTTQLQELNAELHALRVQKSKLENELSDVLSRHASEFEEWQQFQKDLQVAVVIANNFRAETQESMEKISEDNMKLKEQCLNQQLELDRLHMELQSLRASRSYEDARSPARSSVILSNNELRGKVAGCMPDRELAALRDGRRQDQRSQSLSVKALIKSIEEQRKSGCSSMHSSHTGSRRNSTDTETSFIAYQDLLKSPTSPSAPSSPASPTKDFRTVGSFTKSPAEKASLQPRSSGTCLAPVAETPPPKVAWQDVEAAAPKVTSQLSSILKDRNSSRRNSNINEVDKKDSSGKDPLSSLAKQMGGSKRNALLKWCQQKTLAYSGVDITNFSSSWNDGLAFCALLHSYLPDKVLYSTLNSDDKRKNFTLAFSAAESVGIPTSLSLNEMVAMERPDWQAVMAYVTNIYKHFEVDSKQAQGSSPSPSAL
ncbi:cytospin-A-like isoform X6 [Pomacea canaliculata]|uniref:cytospin-A-like isoform X6 n=1 Tax=Pomacea canaliculata TaxID=400727 RepID=UPI000D73220C|nr:cytospin-A-like isoform X6 [Pomacea canaliculata]